MIFKDEFSADNGYFYSSDYPLFSLCVTLLSSSTLDNQQFTIYIFFSNKVILHHVSHEVMHLPEMWCNMLQDQCLCSFLLVDSTRILSCFFKTMLFAFQQPVKINEVYIMLVVLTTLCHVLVIMWHVHASTVQHGLQHSLHSQIFGLRWGNSKV